MKPSSCKTAFRAYAGWLFFALYFGVLVWSAHGLWHVRHVLVFFAVIFGLVVPLVIAIGFIGRGNSSKDG